MLNGIYMSTQLINNRYQVLDKLGVGGMGTVYLAEDLLFDNKKIAIKLLSENLNNETNLEAFKNS